MLINQIKSKYRVKKIQVGHLYNSNRVTQKAKVKIVKLLWNEVFM